MFDCTELFAALDDQRRERGLDWNQLADDLFEQSFALNAELMDHGICPGAVVRFRNRGSISCQYAMFMLRWLDRAPEEFLTRPVVEVGDVRLPEAGPAHRLRWDLNRLYTELDHARTERGLSWAGLVIGRRQRLPRAAASTSSAERTASGSMSPARSASSSTTSSSERRSSTARCTRTAARS